ncbi:MAG: methyltransferase domain-containing protein, partial [Burkholderiales bacterium]
GALLEKTGEVDRAEQLYREASQIDPHCPDAHYLLASLLVAQGRFLEARHSNSLGLIADPTRDKSRIKLGIAYCEVGQKDRAIALMENWLIEEPGNPVASHMLAAFRGDAPERCSERYVEAAFDKFAAQFDSILTRLEYAGPRLLREELQRLDFAPNSLKVLDLGCGTGLNGQILKSVSLSLTGVDISQAMLDAAQNAQCYDSLFKSEICEFLDDGNDRFDLVASIDTLIYFGNLGPVFSKIHARLAPGGQFVFTTEKLAPDSGEKSYELGITGRYRHSEDYVARLLEEAGFEPPFARNAAIRKESGQPVEGQLYSARKRR